MKKMPKKLLLLLFACLILYGFTDRQNVKILTPVGKLINHGSSSMLGDTDLWRMENYRYYERGIGTRLGMKDYIRAYNTANYTEVDVGGNRLLKSSLSGVSINQVTNDEDVYLYRDLGANSIDGDFTFCFRFVLTSGSNLPTQYIWAVTNSVDDATGIDVANGDFIGLYASYSPATTIVIGLQECNNGTLTSDTYTSGAGALNTVYYFKVVRDESIGTYGTIYCYIYSDSAMTALVDTLSVTLTEKQDFRYHFWFLSSDNNEATKTWSGTIHYNSASKDIVSIVPFNQENKFYSIAVEANPSGTTYWQIENGYYPWSSLYTTSATTQNPFSGGMCRDSLVLTDSSGVSIWGGVSTFPTAILVESPKNVFTNRSLWIYDGVQHTVTSGNTWYVGYSRPFDAVQADKDSGTWDTSFLSSVTPEFVGGVFRYWATCVVATGNSTFESPKINTSPRPLSAHWDGQDWQFAQAALFSKSGASEYQDYSLYVADSSPEYYMDVSEWDSGGTIYFVFPRLPREIRLEFPENNKNEVISSVSGYYWNGSTYTLMPGFSDGTSHGGAAFAQDGNLKFDYITNWETRTVGENTFEGYAMYLKVSKTIDNYVRIYKVSAIPYYKSPNDYHFKRSLIAYNRVFLYNGDDLGRFIVSSENEPDVFIGSDAVTWEDNYRVGRDEKVVAAVPISFGVMWMKESENVFMQGYNPETYELQSLPNTVPCVASQSAVVFNRTEGSFILYQAADGPYAIDSAGNNLPFNEDIKAYWENGNGLEIPKAWLERSIGWQDPINDTYNLLVASGSGSTQFNTQLVYDMKLKKWSPFTRDNNVEISYGTYFKDNTNQRLQLAGGYAGQVWQLDKGTTDDGYAIISDYTTKAYAFDICRAELRKVAFGYELPDATSITGCTMYVTPSIYSGHTAYQTGVTLTSKGFTMKTPSGDDPGRVGNYHKIRLRVPGRLFLNRQLMEVREAPCPGD